MAAILTLITPLLTPPRGREARTVTIPMAATTTVEGSGDGSLIRLFAFEDAVDDSVWDSGESGELAEAGSLFETGKYYLSA